MKRCTACEARKKALLRSQNNQNKKPIATSIARSPAELRDIRNRLLASAASSRRNQSNIS